MAHDTVKVFITLTYPVSDGLCLKRVNKIFMMTNKKNLNDAISYLFGVNTYYVHSSI